MRILFPMILVAVGCTSSPKVKLSAEQKTRLFSCKDPDLTKLAPTATITLCNGTEAVGTMPNCASDGQIDCFANSSFKAASGSVDATKIRSGTTVAGVAGTLADCSSDGQATCVATSTFKAANTEDFTTIDVRTGISVAGTSGSLALCKNGADTTLFDNTAAPAAAGLDIWDTIDDYANGGTFPAENAFSSISGSICSASNWSDATADGTCDAPGDECVMRDRISGLYWTELQATSDWATAVTTCDGLSFGGQTDWRVPTQKELMQAYVDGAISKANADWITLAQFNADIFWSSTTVSTNTAQQIPVSLATGWSPQGGDATGNNHHITCVRP